MVIQLRSDRFLGNCKPCDDYDAGIGCSVAISLPELVKRIGRIKKVEEKIPLVAAALHSVVVESWNRRKMTIITLKSIKSILSTMGLLARIGPTASRQRIQFINYWPNVMYTVPLLTLLFPLAAYFYANMVNLIKATDAFYVIAATLMCIGQYWFLVVQKPELSHLVLRLQYLVDQSTFKWPVISMLENNVLHFSLSFTNCRRDEPIVRCLSKCWIENIPLYHGHEGICHFFVIDLLVPAIRVCRCSFSDGRSSFRRLVLAV